MGPILPEPEASAAGGAVLWLQPVAHAADAGDALAAQLLAAVRPSSTGWGRRLRPASGHYRDNVIVFASAVAG